MSQNIEKKAVILNTQQVNAIVHGAKTQHRVPVLTSVQAKDGFEWAMGGRGGDNVVFVKGIDIERSELLVKPPPFGAVGDLLNIVGDSSGRRIRLGLKITAIRVEQLQEISHKDAVSEGVNHFDIEARLRDQPLSVAQIVFSRHWDTKHEDHHMDWESNPWVWVIEFEEVTD